MTPVFALLVSITDSLIIVNRITMLSLIESEAGHVLTRNLDRLTAGSVSSVLLNINHMSCYLGRRFIGGGFSVIA